jgi:hypothetical protein
MTEAEIKSRLRQFIEDNNGQNSWKGYVGGQLEYDIAQFVLIIIQNLREKSAASRSEQLGCDCDKWHDRMEESNNNCSTCDRPIIS